MRRFEGRTAFISGGSRGIGFACAHRLASEGADVFLAAANEENLASARKQIEENTGCAVGIHASDLSLLAGCEGAASSALAFGPIDILVNCAGATKGGIFPGQPDEEMIDGFALKFHGAVRLSRFLWPSLKKLHGNVVSISGGFARTPDADFMVGGAVNAALANFSKALAAKGLEDDVNVNWVHPGLTVTDRMKTIIADRAIQQNKSREVIEAERVKEEGLRRLGQPEDVATLVAFLCSAEARHIHGSAVTVDGGGSKGYY